LNKIKRFLGKPFNTQLKAENKLEFVKITLNDF
jgi:hypothetical protein